MKYNSKYNRWVSKDGLVYRYSKVQDKLILCKLYTNKDGYLITSVSKSGCKKSVHRVIYETFVGEIPEGYEIDHINTIRNDNRLENLRVVNRSENMLNPITRKHSSEVHKRLKHSEETKKKISESHIHKTFSEFGKKFFEHYGLTKCDNPKLYCREFMWYCNHNHKCRWE